MRKYYSILTLLFIVLLGMSCDDFGDDFNNISPDVAQNIDNNPELLLTGVIREPINRMVGAAWSEGNLMAQYSARFVFTSFDQFEWGSQEGEWNRLYLSIRDAQQLKQIARSLNNPSYEAAGLVMEAWMFQILTDMWGDVPYSEAAQAKMGENYTPFYTPQEQIYSGILDSLDLANTLLGAEDAPAIQGDILLGGDISRWRKFANSLRMRAALRLSNVKPDISQSVISTMANSPEQYPILESNEDNVALTYLSSNPSVFPISEAAGYRSGSFNEYRMSETVEGVLKQYGDPRLQTWYNPTASSNEQGDPQWSGMLNGVVDGNAYVYKGGDAFLSKFSDQFYFSPNAIEGMIIKYDEVQFILAEAAQRSWITGDAQSYYENGVGASFDYWAVAMPDGYLAQEGVSYDGSLETILNQKWLALLYTDYQGFIEFKRTGFPTVIQPGPDAFFDTYPSRFEYPSEERTLNKSNYDEAVSRQGINPSQAILTPVWWEGN